MFEKEFRKKTICGFEIWLMVIGIVAFSYLIAEVDRVGASTYFPTGCCLEDNEGGTCQNMLMLDAKMCAGSLVATDCEETDQCKKGCCYDSDSGLCTLNSPKGDCISDGGNWSSDSSCEIPQCSLGCCILGEEAAVTTTRECTLLSREFNFEKSFFAMDSDGTCNSYTGLSQEGACVSNSDDYSNEKNCVFTNKGSCQGSFYQGYLCTHPDIGTLCEMTRKTTCLEGKDQVYFVDTCGNRGNIYDAERVEDEEYWKKVISHKDSCSEVGVNCGNCDYLEGSRCYEKKSMDEAATYGDYVCRDLSCKNGKQHGESWCIYDYDFTKFSVAPVGSRSFYASCIEGEVEITGCADFNQEICKQNQDSDNGKTEARCFVNDWRSCLDANSKDSYTTIEKECVDYDDCIMFNEAYDGELKRSDGEYFASFNPEKLNSKQGSVDNLEDEEEVVISHCVPKYTPGFQFWNDVVEEKEEERFSYGGGEDESNAICDLGSFTCVSKVKRKCKLGDDWHKFSGLCAGGSSLIVNNPDCDPWYDEANWECNLEGVTSTIKTKELPNYLAALNSRCKSLGSCGANVNIAGEVKNSGYSISRIIIDSKGKTKEESENENYSLSEDYLSSLSGKAGLIKLGSLNKLTGLVIKTENAGESSTIEDITTTFGSVYGGYQAMSQIGNFLGVGAGVASTATAGMVTLTMPTTIYTSSIAGSLSTTATVTSTGGTTTITMSGTEYLSSGLVENSAVTPVVAEGSAFSGFLSTLAAAAIGAVAGYFLGKLIVKNKNWSPGRTEEFLEGMSAAGALAGAVLYTTYVTIIGQGCVGGPLGCVIGIVIAALYSIYENCIDDRYDESQYYVLNFKCEAWEPPVGGDCELCNNDIRPCSEYRCKSLGMNCEYYADLGEPGVCVDEQTGVWSAKIVPWLDVLTEGHIYTAVQHDRFMIEQEDEQLIEAWTPIKFGITTDKASECKLDVVHTDNYDEMSFSMISENHYDHSISLSPHINNSESESGPGIVTGENRYYIRCKNFAGQINDAEFVVELGIKDGPDLTSPGITRFSLDSESYLGFGSNQTDIVVYVNEPSECKYSKDLDLAYEVMPSSMVCVTSPSGGSMGEWPCYGTLKDLEVGSNNFYFKCKDQPDLEEGGILRRNTNQKSEELVLRVCSVGLKITSLEPEEEVIGGRSPVETELKVSTEGCIDGGRAICSYKFESGDYSSTDYIRFLDTDSLEHKQVFSTIVPGIYNITVKCEDEAGNLDYANSKIEIEIDADFPRVVKAYDLDNKLNIITNEDSECSYVNDPVIGCGFDFEEGIQMIGQKTVHTSSWKENQDYYVKCKDGYENQVQGCGIIIKTY